MKWSSSCEFKDLGVANCVQFECTFALDCADGGSASLLWLLREQGGGKIVKRVARMSTDREGVANNPGYCDTPDEVTKSYFVQQTVNTIYHLPNFVVSNGGGREGVYVP